MIEEKKILEEFYINVFCNFIFNFNFVRKNLVVSKFVFYCIKMDVWYLRDFELKKNV